MHKVLQLSISVLSLYQQIEKEMTTIKSNQTISCTSIEDARVKSDVISNGVIVMKDSNYSIVNYKTYEQLKSFGYVQVR